MDESSVMKPDTENSNLSRISSTADATSKKTWTFQFISVNLVYKDTENVMFIILGVTKHIYKENNNYKQ